MFCAAIPLAIVGRHCGGGLAPSPGPLLLPLLLHLLRPLLDQAELGECCRPELLSDCLTTGEDAELGEGEEVWAWSELH